MQPTPFIWHQGTLVPWAEAKVHVLTHAIHYGSAVFEGIRFYRNQRGTAIFKLTEHIDRLFYSAKQLAMTIPFSKQEIMDASITTVMANELTDGYIRPLAYYGYGPLRVTPTKDFPVEVSIACWPWANYHGQQALDLVISPYIRIHPRSTVANAKISGHYVNSLLATLALRNTPYHEALLLDVDGYVAEASAANIFIVKNGTLLTPPVGTILEGITRDTVIEIAQHLSIPLEQKKITPEAILQADEAFLCGTAVEIIPIRSLDDQLIGVVDHHPMTNRIAATFHAITQGTAPGFEHALIYLAEHSA